MDNKFNFKDGVTLRDYFDAKFQDLEDKMDLQFKLSQTALDKAENATNIRLEGMNEFRSSLQDQTSNYLTKSEYETRHQNLTDKMEAMQKIIWMGLGAIAILELVLRFIK